MSKHTPLGIAIRAIKAETLRDAAEELQQIDTGFDAVFWTDEGYESVAAWLSARADQIEGADA